MTPIWRSKGSSKTNPKWERKLPFEVKGQVKIKLVKLRVPRGVANGGGGGESKGSWPPHFWKPGRWTPRFVNEVAKIRCFLSPILGYFGVGWPPCRRFDPPLKNPWRRPWEYLFAFRSRDLQINSRSLKLAEVSTLKGRQAYLPIVWV